MEDFGSDIFHHISSLYLVCRSLTGPGLRRTLRYIGEHIPLVIHEVPSGTQVLDWQVPDEWTIRSATIHTLDGQKVVDFADHNLHILQYSTPIDAVVSMDELRSHLYALPDQPTLIPYRTSYYNPNWGFCLAQEQLDGMTEPAYRIRIDSELKPGSLSYGECFLPGTSDDEVLISVHCCHPSLANDNLSGLALALELARLLGTRQRRFGYRFLFMPATIGAITWLHHNRDKVGRVRHGLVLSCLGDGGPMTYKLSRRGDAMIDRIAAHVLAHDDPANRVLRFEPYGYDERQYCSPGFDLPVGCLMRSPNGTFPEYHTSADNLSFVTPGQLARSFRVIRKIVRMIESDATYRNTSPYGEPQLGRRGLYNAIGGTQPETDERAHYDAMTMLWVLNLSDGQHSLLDIAERSGSAFAAVRSAADDLIQASLLVTVGQEYSPVSS